MSGNLEIRLNVADQSWERTLGNAGTVFHTLNWNRCVVQSFGGTFIPTIVLRDEKPLAVVPVYIGEPWATSGHFRIGAIGYGGPYPIGDEAFDYLSNQANFLVVIGLLESAIQARCTVVNGYPDHRFDNVPWLNTNTTQILLLTKSADEILNAVIDKSLRYAIRKAEKRLHSVRPLERNELATAISLINATQEAVGASYRTPVKFLENLLQIPEQPKTFVLGAFVEETLCATGVFLIDRRGSFHLFNGWDRTYAEYNGNQAILWRAICEALSDASPFLNLGESHYPSLAAAKARWGAKNVSVFRLSEKDLLARN